MNPIATSDVVPERHNCWNNIGAKTIVEPVSWDYAAYSLYSRLFGYVCIGITARKGVMNAACEERMAHVA